MTKPDLAKLRWRMQAFFRWWADGLGYLVPQQWRARLWPGRARLRIELHEDTVRFTRTANGPAHEETFPLSDTQAITAWLHAHSDRNDAVSVASPRVLHKSLIWPLAAESNVGAILANEMDRQTPFTLDQVHFDYCVTHRNPDAKMLRVDLFITLRDVAAAVSDQVRGWGVIPLALTPIATTPADINLLPAQTPDRARQSRGATQRLLAGVTALLVLLVLYAPLIKHEQILERLEAEVDAKRTAAKQARDLLSRSEAMTARSAFVTTQRAKDHAPIDVLDELTRILPDDSFATRVVINNGDVQLQGEAGSATTVLALLEGSQRFSRAAFRSPVTRNQKSAKDKFHIVAQLEATP